MFSDPSGGGAGRPGESRRITDEKLFRYLLDFEVPKAQRLQYCVSVVCLGSDLPTPEAADLSQTHVLDTILLHTRMTDAITALPGAAFAVLLIDAETETLAAICQRLKGELSLLTSVRSGGTWSAGAGCYPKTAARGTDLMRQAHELMTLARGQGGDRFYIAS
ncbi:MAG TPA: hypothetical protein VGT02_17880 [Methylomirabilota bacterium]|jgi:hypothetical protein|nr:hypothetical protein [Methylomirabilota bacterium]